MVNETASQFPAKLAIALQFCLPPGTWSPGGRKVSCRSISVIGLMTNKLMLSCVVVICESEDKKKMIQSSFPQWRRQQ